MHKITSSCIPFQKKTHTCLPSYPEPNLTSRHRYETLINYQRIMDVVEENQSAMREEMNAMKEKMDKLLEAMMAMSRKEDNPHIIVDAINIASQLGSSSLHIPEVNNPEFGLPIGYTPPEGVTSHPPIRIYVVNLDAQDHYVASTRHKFPYDEKDSHDAYFMHLQAPHMVHVVVPLPDHVIEKMHALEEKFKAMKVHYTPGLDVVDMCLVSGLVIPLKFKVPDFEILLLEDGGIC